MFEVVGKKGNFALSFYFHEVIKKAYTADSRLF
jgi:hypothetical protein